MEEELGCARRLSKWGRAVDMMLQTVWAWSVPMAVWRRGCFNSTSDCTVVEWTISEQLVKDVADLDVCQSG